MDLVPLPGNSDKFKRIVMQVQAALIAYGYYTGAVDGIVGPGTKKALQQLQADYGLKVTGTITPELLTSLRIVAE
jgi:His-Xaa-Ser repeat protein HxsA